MKGLIIKDLLLIKNNSKMFYVVIVFFFMTLLNGMTATAFILPLVSVMVSIATFSYDEYNKWDAFATSLPCNRKTIVISKYLVTIIIIFGSSVVAFVLTSLVTLFNHTFNLAEILGLIGGGMVGTVIAISLLYPALYKFGVEKGRIAIFIITFCLMFILGGILNLFSLSLENMSVMIEQYILFIIPVITLGLLYGSYSLSKRIYLKKEF